MLTQLDRVEAMLAELLRRATPPEGVPAMLERLSAYDPGDIPNVGRLGRWLTEQRGEFPHVETGGV